VTERQLAIALGPLPDTPESRPAAISVVPRLNGPVTSFLHSYTVTEQGTAVIWGHDASGQAEQIIEHVAHPSVRQQLREAGRSLGLRL
jgi:acyl-CoA hydrolase